MITVTILSTTINHHYWLITIVMVTITILLTTFLTTISNDLQFSSNHHENHPKHIPPFPRGLMGSFKSFNHWHPVDFAAVPSLETLQQCRFLLAGAPAAQGAIRKKIWISLETLDFPTSQSFSSSSITHIFWSCACWISVFFLPRWLLTVVSCKVILNQSAKGKRYRPWPWKRYCCNGSLTGI